MWLNGRFVVDINAFGLAATRELSRAGYFSCASGNLIQFDAVCSTQDCKSHYMMLS